MSNDTPRLAPDEPKRWTWRDLITPDVVFAFGLCFIAAALGYTIGYSDATKDRR